MCGICGVFAYRDRCDDGGVSVELIEEMCAAIVHRGPDDQGLHVEPGLGLGMRRLAIIDLDAGQQPIVSEDGTLTLVCNGEIYNHAAWRRRLERGGHRFSGGSDCEVIVHLYEEYGLGCVEHLRGMFAFALWDRPRRRLLLARDRIGIKPLYFADIDGRLAFGSEIKALLQAPFVERRIDAEALHHYLSLNYLPAPYSLVEGVRQLEPGSLLIVEQERVTKRSYWDLVFDAHSHPGEHEWIQAVREKLAQCVDSHLMSDVPFGAFLSGGVDSSAVVGLMTEALRRPVATFAIDFAEPSFSEAQHARAVAERFGSDHHELNASPELVTELDEMIWYADDPLADSSMLPVYLLARFAKERVTMVLTGDGGDEVFAGYPTYNAYWVRRLYRLAPRMVRQALVRRVVESLPVSLSKVSFDFMAKRFVAGAELDAEEAHFWWRVILSEPQKLAIYSDRMRAQLTGPPTASLFRRAFAACGSRDPLSRMLYVDTRLYLPADMLTKVDRMTMAHALEARVPFLDHELVELAARIPSSIKMKRFRQKHVLKEAMRGMLPGAILQRRKAGFNVPVNRWLADDRAGALVALLDADRLAASGVFRPAAIQKMLAQHRARTFDHSFGLWSVICFQIWYERFIDTPTVKAPIAVKRRWASALTSAGAASGPR